MDDDEVCRRRESHKALFLKLLGHLGRKEFDAFEACLAPDMVQEWPYRPVPSMADRLVGAAAVRQLMEQGMSDFDPYEYEVLALHEMVDPDLLIAEYASRSFYHPRAVPYRNRYISVLRFAGGRLAYWSEYVNPLVIKEALLDDFTKPIEQRIARRP